MALSFLVIHTKKSYFIRFPLFYSHYPQNRAFLSTLSTGYSMLIQQAFLKSEKGY